MATEIIELRRVIDGLTQRVDRLETTKKRQPLPRKSSLAQQEKLETWIAGYWFARLGIISLVTGVAFLVADSYTWLGAPLKILLGYSIAMAFVAMGRTFLKKPAALGQILVAGGLGVAYYTTYAMHYVPSAQLITSPVLALVLLALMVLAIVLVAHRMDSETVAGVALFLGLHTGMVSPIGGFTLLSSVLLALGAAFFLAKKRWVYVPISTLLAVYATHLLWILGNPMISTSSSHSLDHLTLSISFAALYFATFSVALVAAASELRRAPTLAFASLNWAALVAILCFEFHTHDASGLALALGVLALCMALVALLSRLRLGHAAAEIHLVLAVLTLALATWVAVHGVAELVLAWSLTSLFTLGLAWFLRMRMLATASSALLALAFLAQFRELDNLALATLLGIFTIAHHRLAHALAQRDKAYSAHAYAHASAVALLALAAIASALPPKLVVLLWLKSALVLFVLGVVLKEFSYRLAGIVILVLSFARLFLIDMASISSVYRVAAFLVLGVILLAISLMKTRGSEAPQADCDA